MKPFAKTPILQDMKDDAYCCKTWTTDFNGDKFFIWERVICHVFIGENFELKAKKIRVNLYEKKQHKDCIGLFFEKKCYGMVRWSYVGRPYQFLHGKMSDILRNKMAIHKVIKLWIEIEILEE